MDITTGDFFLKNDLDVFSPGSDSQENCKNLSFEKFNP